MTRLSLALAGMLIAGAAWGQEMLYFPDEDFARGVCFDQAMRNRLELRDKPAERDELDGLGVVWVAPGKIYHCPKWAEFKADLGIKGDW